jgi:hypothetical protein
VFRRFAPLLTPRFAPLWLAWSLVACGALADSKDDTVLTPATAAGADEPQGLRAARVWPERCVEVWQTLFEHRGLTVSDGLARAGNEIVFNVLDVSPNVLEIRAVAEDGAGASRLVASPARYDDLWVEGERLLYRSSHQLFEVPLAGGASVRVANGVPVEGPSPGGPDAALLTPDALYWARPSADALTTSIWQRSRSSATGAELAQLAGVGLSELALASDLLLAALSGAVMAVPLDGATPWPLAQVDAGELVGLGSQGAYYSRVANASVQGGEALEYELLRAPVDGSAATRVWRGSAGQRLDRLAESGAGLLATGEYYLADRRPRSVIVYLEGSGAEHVVACAPIGESIVGRPMLTEDALYFIAAGAGSWRLVKLPLER